MNWSILLAILSALCFVLFVYPYAIYGPILAALPRQDIERRQHDASVSLLFCAYNEAPSLGAKIENLRRLKSSYPDLEILAYDDGSQDATAALLGKEERLLTLVKGPGRRGKAAGMKRLAELARGTILIFTDANVLLDQHVIANILQYYADEEIGGVCGTLKYSDDARSETASVSSSYWSLDERLRTLESATGSVMGADGSIFSIRRSLYPSFPDNVLDDLTVSMSVVFAGKRLVKAGDVIAYENSVVAQDEERRRKIRIGARAMRTHVYLRPKLRNMSAIDRFKYTSRKVLRWFGASFLVGGISFGTAALYLANPSAALLAAVSVCAILMLALAPVRSARKVWRAIELLFATQYGVFQGALGRDYVTWSPAKTR
ncbi:glycosyltransferase [Altererythrobacter sp. MF3-039]|uniref:glycosyltransferase n=1 Tax=Altererythrobacter sp. MF3-039 TaxID=3252901 RepID=UPI00390CBD65